MSQCRRIIVTTQGSDQILTGDALIGTQELGKFKGARLEHPATLAADEIPLRSAHGVGHARWSRSGESAHITAQLHESSGGVAASEISSRYIPLHTAPLAHVRRSAPTGRTNMVSPVVELESDAELFVGFGPRLLAHLIDLAFILLFPVVGIAATFLLDPMSPIFDNRPGEQSIIFIGLTILGVFAIYHVLQTGLWGQTLGKKLIGIQVVTADGHSPSFARAVLRLFGFFFSLLIAGWGLVMLALDARRQGLHDKIAETYVVPEVRQEKNTRPRSGSAHDSVERREEHAAEQAANIDFARPVTAFASVGRPAGEGLVAPPGGQGFGRGFVTVPFAGIEQDAMPDSSTDRTKAEIARALFKTGLAGLESGVVPTSDGYNIDPAAARAAAASFSEILEIVPSSVLYRYYYGVSLRYAVGLEAALREIKLVLGSDPNNFEARNHVTYGRYWHDAFVYHVWPGVPPCRVGDPVPMALARLLPPTDVAVTRAVLLRDGANKMAAFLSRAPRSAWSVPPLPHMWAGIDVVLSRTQHGPVLALYAILSDGTHSPYVGETFLNPREKLSVADDACRLGQHMLEQLARQDHTYLIFIDEQNRLLLSRKLPFDTATQVMLARVLYETQSLPPLVLEPDSFRRAAHWHMEHHSLEDVAEQFRLT